MYIRPQLLVWLTPCKGIFLDSHKNQPGEPPNKNGQRRTIILCHYRRKSSWPTSYINKPMEYCTNRPSLKDSAEILLMDKTSIDKAFNVNIEHSLLHTSWWHRNWNLALIHSTNDKSLLHYPFFILWTDPL